jgi:NitT/TauT family transport system permease protein
VVFWRPLTAWVERFKVEQSEAAEIQRSFVLDLLRRSRWPRLLGSLRRRIAGPWAGRNSSSTKTPSEA